MNMRLAIRLLPSLGLLVFPGPLAFAQELPAAPQDPCPLPSAAVMETPDDLAKVQADIDRFTLCMERAQLLQRLNELALENQEALMGYSPDNPGMKLDKKPADLPDFKKPAAAESSPPALPVLGGAMPKTEEPPAVGWTVVSVFGSGGNLQARISSPEGSIEQVRTGDTLSDGSTVKTISVGRVVITDKSGKDTTLGWQEQAL